MDDQRRQALEHLARVIPGLDKSVLERIPAHAPDWTAHNGSDPGITLVQLFAYLAEELLYRRVDPEAFPHTVENSRQLRDLLALIAGELSSIRDELEQLYGDQFAATAGTPQPDSLFPGIFLEEVPFEAKSIPGVATSTNRSFPRLPGRLPGKLEAPNLNATGNEVEIETIELVGGQLVADPDPDD